MSHFDRIRGNYNNAAPNRLVRTSSVIFSTNRRFHRRGTRSSNACLRRSVSKDRRTLPGMSLCKSRDEMPVPTRIRRPLNLHVQFQNGISILSFNIQCLLAHLSELIHVLQIHQPHIVFLQET